LGTKGKKMSIVTRQKMSMVKKGILNSNYGNKHSTNTKKIMSELKQGSNNPMFGKTGTQSPSFGKVSPQLGKTLKELHGIEKERIIKEKQSNSAKNKPKVQCPHCFLVGTTGNMKRWHFDNCKENR
jgi:hypothetical protein